VALSTTEAEYIASNVRSHMAHKLLTDLLDHEMDPMMITKSRV
jgi:hypothetical protein